MDAVPHIDLRPRDVDPAAARSSSRRTCPEIHHATHALRPKDASEVMLALIFDSRAEVDAFHDASVRQGGTADVNPVGDYGFMYSRSTTDLDGHLWEAVWMDMSAVPPSE